MNDIHFVTLPVTQANWLFDMASELGVITKLGALTTGDEKQVMTCCSDADRQALWELFKAEFDRCIYS